MHSEYARLADEVATLNQNRASIYRLLSSLYWQEITDEQIDRLKSFGTVSLDFEDESMAEGWADIEAFLARRNSGTRQELAVDYAHTFLAAGNNEDRMAIPFESVFVSETGLLMQEPRDEVCKAFYGEHVSPAEDLHAPEDHIAFELEFIAVMSQRCSEALEADDFQEAARIIEVQSSFHEEHLANWIDVFCDAVESNCRTRFYQGIAKLTRGWVKLDGACIEDMRAAMRAA